MSSTFGKGQQVTDSSGRKITKKRDYRQIVPKNIQAVIAQLGWSHQRFGDEIGKSQTQATKYINGNSTPSYEVMGEIEAKTGVPLPEYFSEDRPPTVGKPLEDGLKMGEELLQKVGPLLSAAAADGATEIQIVPGTNDSRIEDFLRDVVQSFQPSDAFFDLLSEGADRETLQIEFLREYCHALIAGGGPRASRAKKVLNDILTSERVAKK